MCDLQAVFYSKWCGSSAGKCHFLGDLWTFPAILPIGLIGQALSSDVGPLFLWPFFNLVVMFCISGDVAVHGLPSTGDESE